MKNVLENPGNLRCLMLNDKFFELVGDLQKRGYSKSRLAVMFDVSESTISRVIRKNREDDGYVVKQISFPVLLYQNLSSQALNSHQPFDSYLVDKLSHLLKDTSDSAVETLVEK